MYTVKVMPKPEPEVKRPGTTGVHGQHKLGPKTTPLEYDPIDWKAYSIPQRLMGAFLGIVRMFPNLASLNNRSSETKDRLKTFLSTIGLISALLLTMTYPLCMNPLSLDVTKYTTTDDKIKPWCSEGLMVKTLRASNTLGNFSAGLSITVLINVALMVIEIDLVLTDQDLVDFMKRFSSIFYVIVLLFLTSILSVVAQLLFATSVLYPADDYLLLFAFAGIFLVWCLIMAISTLYFIGSRLWYRVNRQSDRIRHSEIKTGMERAMNRAKNHMNIFLEHKLESELENILEDAVVTQVGDVLGKLMERTMRDAISSVMDDKEGALEDMVEGAMKRARDEMKLS